MAQGILGSADLTAGVDTLLFTVAGAAQVFNIRFANRNAYTVRVRVAIGTGASPALKDYVDYDLSLLYNGIMEDTGLVASVGEKIWVRSDTANVSVRAHGL